ncbi:MAG: hypothetical protein IJZ90_03540 [Clostridia bacterium]|nr:hypothetical protein [Clostridia bacterium]
MKEKLSFLGKVFLISLAGCLVGSVLFIAINKAFSEAHGLLYLVAGVSTAAFYLNFIDQKKRNAATHIITDIAVIIGVFISQLANFLICYSSMINDDVVPGRTMNAFQKTFYVYFSKGGFNKIFISDTGTPSVMTDEGSFYVWTLYVFYTIVALIGLYIIFGISKIIEIGASPKGNRKKKGKKNK